jgi:recombinational DNA repair ATPase RecF
MRIVKFIIENYKALKGKTEFNPNGASFMLIGSNGQGKTSAGRALIDFLTKSVPSKPVTTGQTDGTIEYEFDNGQKLIAKFTEKGTQKLELLSPEGLKINTPKEFIQKLTGNGMAFNIDEFMSMAPKPRRELLEKIAGVDLSDLNAKEKEFEDLRRDANAEAKAAHARVKPFDTKLADLEEVDVTESVETLTAMNNANAAYEKVDNGIKQRASKILDHQSKILELQKEIELYQTELEKGIAWKKDNIKFTDSEIEKQELLIKKADEIKEAKRIKKDVEDYNTKSEKALEYDEKIKDIRAEKESRIKSASLPAEGLAFEGEELLIDGIPFESSQIAASRKLIAAIQIAASMLGEIKYLHFDGAALDKASADKILDWAEKNDLQLCLERPLWEGGDGVRMEIIEGEFPAKIEKMDNIKPISKTDVKAEQKDERPEMDERKAAKAEIEKIKNEVKKAALPW